MPTVEAGKSAFKFRQACYYNNRQPLKQLKWYGLVYNDIIILHMLVIAFCA